MHDQNRNTGYGRRNKVAVPNERRSMGMEEEIKLLYPMKEEALGMSNEK